MQAHIPVQPRMTAAPTLSRAAGFSLPDSLASGHPPHKDGLSWHGSPSLTAGTE